MIKDTDIKRPTCGVCVVVVEWGGWGGGGGCVEIFEAQNSLHMLLC